MKWNSLGHQIPNFYPTEAPKLKKDPCRPTEKNKKKRYFLEIPVRGLRVVIRTTELKSTVESNTEIIWQDATQVCCVLWRWTDQVEEGVEAPAAGSVVALLRRPPVQCGADEIVVSDGDGGPRVHDHRLAAGEGGGARAHGGGAGEPEERPHAEADHLEQKPRRHSAKSTRPRINKKDSPGGQARESLQPEGKCRGKGTIPSWRNLKGTPLRQGGNREGSCRLHHVKHLDAGEPLPLLWCGVVGQWVWPERWMQIERWPWWFGFPWFQGGRAALLPPARRLPTLMAVGSTAGEAWNLIWQREGGSRSRSRQRQSPKEHSALIEHSRSAEQSYLVSRTRLVSACELSNLQANSHFFCHNISTLLYFFIQY